MRDLPWATPLAEWRSRVEGVVDLEQGLSRHEVIFLAIDRDVYALKEMPEGLAQREYELLVSFGERRLPVVEPVGHVACADPTGKRRWSVLITRFLDYSLPYRTLFHSEGLERYRRRLLDALASLLVRLHVAGVYWGDCSLSNTLFRRDAGELQAYLVDAETASALDRVTDGQRRQDLMIMEENVFTELSDLSREGRLPEGIGVRETGATIRDRYERLWDEITREETIRPDEAFRIHERIRSLNDLGFTVGEVNLAPEGDQNRVRLRTIVTDRDYHGKQLHTLTGIVAGDRQAALMLNEIREMQATLGHALQRRLPIGMAAHRWLEERYRPAAERLSAIKEKVGDLPELYCQVLEHKWYMSERAGHDVGPEQAIDDYVQRFQSV